MFKVGERVLITFVDDPYYNQIAEVLGRNHFVEDHYDVQIVYEDNSYGMVCLGYSEDNLKLVRHITKSENCSCSILTLIGTGCMCGQLEVKESIKHKCICSIQDLMYQGCKCGQFKREHL